MEDFARWLRAEWDRVGGFGLIGLGALLLILGYSGVSRSPYVAEQLAYVVSGGLGGLFCLGFGAVLLIGADLHDEWRKLDRIESAIRQTAASSDRPDEVAPPAAVAPPSAALPEQPPSTIGLGVDRPEGEHPTNGRGPAHTPEVAAHAGNGAGKPRRPLSARTSRTRSGRSS